jgi:mannose-1-phosphate guanylyltransferase
MERASRVLNIEATFDWDDVGNWTSVGRHLASDPEGNRHNGPLSALDAAGNLTFTQTAQHVALLGVQDLIVVATPDALLVTHRACAENIKKLAERLPDALK